MGFELTQVATYWGVPVIDSYGTRQFVAPVLIKCRWEDRIGFSIQKEGETIQSKAIVYPATKVEVGGYLMQGDQTATANPQDLKDAYIIQTYGEVPSVNGRTVLRKAVL